PLRSPGPTSPRPRWWRSSSAPGTRTSASSARRLWPRSCCPPEPPWALLPGRRRRSARGRRPRRAQPAGTAVSGSCRFVLSLDRVALAFEARAVGLLEGLLDLRLLRGRLLLVSLLLLLVLLLLRAAPAER